MSTTFLYFQAPAAFGLVSFLLHEGLDRLRIRKHLAIFSAAAPLLTIVTYLVLSLVSILFVLELTNCITFSLNQCMRILSAINCCHCELFTGLSFLLLPKYKVNFFFSFGIIIYVATNDFCLANICCCFFSSDNV